MKHLQLTLSLRGNLQGSLPGGGGVTPDRVTVGPLGSGQQAQGSSSTAPYVTSGSGTLKSQLISVAGSAFAPESLLLPAGAHPRVLRA